MFTASVANSSGAINLKLRASCHVWCWGVKDVVIGVC